MSNILRKLSLFLICAVFLNLTGCGLVVINYDKFGNSSDTATDTLSSETESDEPETTFEPVKNDYSQKIKENLSSITDMKYQNTVFKIASPDTSSLNPDGGLEFISEVAHERNKRVSAKHSISIVSSKVDYMSLYEEVNTAVNSGMYYSDLLMLPQDMVGSFAVNGLLLNLRSMPTLNFEASYFNQSSVGAGSAGFNSYAISGYASIYPYSLPAVFFNKALCDSAGVDMYTLVESGEWTWDKFFIISSSAATTDGVFSWGTTDLGDAVYESVFVSCGHRIVDSGIMQVPSLAFDADSSASTQYILKTLYNDAGSIHNHAKSIEFLSNGWGYFLIDKLSSITQLRGASSDWGIAPIPKYSASDRYYSLAGSDSLMFTCPVTVSTPDKSATILKSLNAASEGVVKDGYISYIQYNYLRDNNSANMLDHIFDNIVYDFSYTYGNLYTEIAYGTYDLIRTSAMPGEDISGLINYRSASLERVFNSQFGLSN
ncbi:MAG: hypothetical protein E7578_08850 [Ruminococcaceae bacterium]|nr:hypothetical protein [Oscillospiraceae bacterium]